MSNNIISKPYRKGDIWYIKRSNGYEIEFISDAEAWEYYREYNSD